MKRFILGLASVFVVCAVQTVFASDEPRKDCYPENKSVILAAFSDIQADLEGPTFAAGEAEARFEEIEGDIRGTAVNFGPAKVEVEFAAKILGENTVANPGTSVGRAKVNIYWYDTSKTGGVRRTTFETGCVQENQTGSQSTVYFGEYEGEFEGAAKTFPFYPYTSKAAVASIAVKEDPNHPGRAELDVVIELGFTCHENIYSSSADIEIGKIAFTNLNPKQFHINNNGTHGLWSFPVGCVPPSSGVE
jgi:hypothetical protein